MSDVTLQQRILNQLWNEGRSKPNSSNKPRGQSTGGKRPSTNSVKQKRGRGRGKSAKARSFKGRSKPAPSQNISKFGGGVKGKHNATIKTAGAIAVKTGSRGLPFAKAIGSSKFLAGANSVPGIALVAGNYVVWKQNLKTLAGIYNIDPPRLSRFLPGYSKIINAAPPPPFEGGQSPGIKYQITIYFDRYRIHNGESLSRGNQRFMGEHYGAVESVSITLEENDNHPNLTANYVNFVVHDQYGNQVVRREFLSGDGLRDELIHVTVVRADGLPDTGGNPPSSGEAQSSSEGTKNNTIIIVLPSERPDNNPTQKSKPPSQNKVNSKSEVVRVSENAPTQAKVSEVAPTQIPLPIPIPTDNTTEPKKPSDSPKVVLEDKTSVEVNNKPKTSTKITRYPKEAPIVFPGVEVIPDPETGVDTHVTRRYADPKIPKDADEVVTTIPFIPIPGRATPIVKNRNDPPRVPPKVTKVNGCKKGCGGAAPAPTSLDPSDSQAIAQLNTGLQALDLGLLNKIDATTTATKNVVTHATYGLEKIQSFADKAWKATHADKVINAISTIAVLHNAAMLSQNVAQSLGDAASAGLNLFGIKNAEGSPIDVNAAIGGTIKAKLTEIFGAAALNTAHEAWLKLNRIHQAVSSTVSAIQGTKNALLEADEITGGHVAQIGNALQDQGTIEEDTYDWMNDKPDYKTPFNGILGRIDNFQEVADRVSNVVNTGLEIKESSVELITTSDELIEATSDFVTARNNQTTQQQTESQSPNIDRLDLLKQEPDDT